MERLALEDPRSPEFLEFIDSLKLDGCSTTADDHRFGETRVGDNGVRSLTPAVVIHDSMMGNGPKLFSRWTKSWLGGSLACWTNGEGETEEPTKTHVGRWRRQKGPDEPQAAVEKEVEDERHRGVQATEGCHAHGDSSSWYFARGSSLASKTARSVLCSRGWRPSRQMRIRRRVEGRGPETVASTIILQQREQKLPCAQGRQLGHGKDGHHCLAKVNRVNWAGGSSKFSGRALHSQWCVWVLHPGELETIVWLQSESILHNLGPENSMYVADMCGDVPNLGGSVVQ